MELIHLILNACLEEVKQDLKILLQVNFKFRIVTAGSDNTIRVWDSKDMGLVNVLNNHIGIEISFMAYC